jgi:hypothetical protein
MEVIVMITMITAKNLFTSKGGVFTGKGLSVVEIPDDIVASLRPTECSQSSQPVRLRL